MLSSSRRGPSSSAGLLIWGIITVFLLSWFCILKSQHSTSTILLTNRIIITSIPSPQQNKSEQRTLDTSFIFPSRSLPPFALLARPWKTSALRQACGQMKERKTFHGKGISLSQCKTKCIALGDGCQQICGAMSAGNDMSCWTCSCPTTGCTSESHKDPFRTYEKPLLSIFFTTSVFLGILLFFTNTRDNTMHRNALLVVLAM